MATVAGIALRDGKINVDDPVGKTVKDGGYDSPRNAQVTWKMHLQQETEWEGNMWGKKDDFVGTEAFGEGERKPRELQRPGTFYEYNDVRINRLGPVAAAHLQEAGARGVPRRDHGPDRRLERVEVGAVPQQLRRHRRQEAGVGQRRHALGRRRVDQLVGHGPLRLPVAARRQVGRPADRAAGVREGGDHAEQVSNSPDYGYLWWLNTQGKNYPGLPPNAYGAKGAGSNTITISPDHDLVVVWRWHRGNEAEFAKRVIGAIKPDRTSAPQ